MPYRKDAQGNRIPVGSTAGINQTDEYAGIRNVLRQAALADPKNAAKYSSVLGMYPDEPKESVSEKNKRIANDTLKESVNTFVSELEDLYYNNKMYKGNNPMSLIEEMGVKSGIIQNSPAAEYWKSLRSKGAQLAKIAGDTGNIAIQEQMNQLVDFPFIRQDKKTATNMFTRKRKNLGLPGRKYDSIGSTSSTPSSWQGE